MPPSPTPFNDLDFKQKGSEPRSHFRFFYLVSVFRHRAVFCHGSVGAMNDVFAGFSIPIVSKLNGLPLFDGAIVFDTRQTAANVEGIIADASHAVRDCDTRQTAATIEDPIADAHHAVRNCDARQTSAITEGTFV